MAVNSVAESQTSGSKLKSFLPILEWLPRYKKEWLRWDVIAALTVWALLVPEGMAYAGIAGMPPETGLYAALLALVGYAVPMISFH
jgi:MFS superfamily sulfate permease-like transporter